MSFEHFFLNKKTEIDFNYIDLKDDNNNFSIINPTLNLYKKINPPENYYKLFQNNMIQNDQTIIEELTCPICFEIVNNPYMCSECNRHFCKACISNLSKCPFRCKYFQKVPMSRLFKKILGNTYLKCFNYENGCNKVIKFENLKHHLEHCEYFKYKCNNIGCEFNGNLNEIKQHVINCEYTEISCSQCKTNLLLKDYYVHKLKLCDNILEKCENCNETINIKNINSHTYDLCLENILKNYKNTLNKKIADELKNQTTNKNIDINNIDNNNLNENQDIQIINISFEED